MISIYAKGWMIQSNYIQHPAILDYSKVRAPIKLDLSGRCLLGKDYKFNGCNAQQNNNDGSKKFLRNTMYNHRKIIHTLEQLEQTPEYFQ